MRIALVCPYDLARPGGVRSHIAGLGQALARRGHAVDVIAPGGRADLDGVTTLRCGGARPIGFGGTQIDITWSAWNTVRAVASRGYDVMHFHTIRNPLVPFQLALAFRGPKIATFHDVPGPDTPAWAAALMSPASELIRRLALRRVIAVSPAVSRYLAPRRHEIIPNGIAVPVALPREGERRAVLYVGRLEPRKDVATLIDAIGLAGADAPPLWIAGDGPLRAELETRAAKRGIANVTFFGEVSDTRKWELLRSAALFVAPSVGGESFGIVLLEAMAAGAPPIAADNRGYHELLKERGDALLFPPGDAAALAARVRTLVDDRTRLAEIRAWGEHHWRGFDWSTLAGRVESVYVAAIADARERRHGLDPRTPRQPSSMNAS
jgi:phosphatidylinositol alpha-mannosyltransferase